MTGNCSTCGDLHYARTLCKKHYQWARNNGVLDNYPRTPFRDREDIPLSPRAQEIVEEVESGVAIRTTDDAYRLGLKPTSLTRALYRAKRPDLARRLHAAANRTGP